MVTQTTSAGSPGQARNRVLEKMLDRLFAGLLNGPSLNCRPAASRQRVDLAALRKLQDVGPEELLRQLLSDERHVKATGRVKAPRRRGGRRAAAARVAAVAELDALIDGPALPGEGVGDAGGEDTAEAEDPRDPAERAWDEQAALLQKLRVIADDARTYEQDTGVHALNIGFPLLSLPPGTFGAKQGGAPATRRVLAPVAFIPVTLALKHGAAPTIHLTCRGEGIDLVTPNTALLAWLEQQTGKATGELAASDDNGQDPWREVAELTRAVCKRLGIDAPDWLPALRAPAPPAEPSELPPAEPTGPETGEDPVSEELPAVARELIEVEPGDGEPIETGMEPSEGRPTEPAGAPEPPAGPPVFAPPDDFNLAPAPRADGTGEEPTVLPSAVLGLFPTANQGLLRDLQAMIRGEGLAGPVLSFIDVAARFDESGGGQMTGAVPPGEGEARSRKRREFGEERLVAVADPCQARAVRLARESRGLVVHGPPGTGKSQTIANIIGDHLSRGQRVLLVCDKRTALDVVADRLDHLGLGGLCALIHDPRRDQRELYMSIRRQLDDLPESSPDEKAEGKLAKVDAELQKLHGELTAYHQALTRRDDGHGLSFHELVGQWLELTPAEAILPQAQADEEGEGEAPFDSAQGRPAEPSSENGQDARARRNSPAAEPLGSVPGANGASSDEGEDAPRPQPLPPLDPSLLQTAHLAESDDRADDVREILRRSLGVAYPKNPWARCAGPTLAEFLARPLAQVRAAAAACAQSATESDATADPNIPPFAPDADLNQHGPARAALAEPLERLVTGVNPPVLAHWAEVFRQPSGADALRRARQKLAGAEPFVTTFRAAPLDPELAMAARNDPPDAARVGREIPALASYLEVASKWWGFFAFKKKSEAAKVLNRYGLTLSAAGAERVRTLLTGYRARLVLRDLVGELSGIDHQAPPPAQRTEPSGSAAGSADTALPPDEFLDKSLSDHAATLDLLIQIGSNQVLAGLSDPIARAMTDLSFAPLFLSGLRKSAPRAAALAALERTLTESRLFEPKWLAAVTRKVRTGHPAGPAFEALAERVDTLEGVLRVRQGLANLPDSLRPAVQALIDESADPDPGATSLRREMLGVEIARRLAADPDLQGIDGQRLAAAFDRYRKLGDDKRRLVRDAILFRWTTRQRERLLAADGNRLNGLGADVRRRLTTRGERAMRLRQVVAIGRSIDGGDPLFDLRPVWMASPETVAQVFPLAPAFDVVVFDEASQCRLEEALPVLVRGGRVTIAGDPQQLPPTRFFETAVAESDADEEIETDQQLFELQQAETEDLLGAALGLDIRQCYLDVHYRSRNADLIEFSNEHFYHSRLQAIPGHPANRPAVAPLRLYRVDGTYSRRVNEAEADKVVEIVRELLRRKEPPSIGIACFNLVQRDLIVERLDELADEEPTFARRLEAARERTGAGSSEGLFVKNLENVQGDERDHIVISTTYGPDPAGRFYRRFGPLGRAGGGRRLNVLVTRARQEIHLVTSIPREAYRTLPEVPEGHTPGGAWLLFAYLKYAEQLEQSYAPAPEAEAEAEVQGIEAGTGEPLAASRPDDAKESEDSADEDGAEPQAAEVRVHRTRTPSPFVQSVASKLLDAGSVGSDVYWGNEGFCVDLALRHPEHPTDVTVGVLCDAARFTGADDPMEWDVFRTAILESQGWQLQRLWSPHLYRDPAGTIRSLLRAAGGRGSAKAER